MSSNIDDAEASGNVRNMLHSQRLNPYNYLTHIIILNNYPILISENHQNKMYNLQIRPEQFTDQKEKAEITLHNWK